jgi:hypothetical protein
MACPIRPKSDAIALAPCLLGLRRIEPSFRSGPSGAVLATLVPGRIELDCSHQPERLSDPGNQPVDAIMQCIASGLILAVINFIAHHCLHWFAPADWPNKVALTILSGVGVGKVPPALDDHVMELARSSQ